MTARDVWEAALTEVSKTGAPSMLLQDFNYFFNKAINQYINKRYNIYDVNQQTADDLRVLKSTAILTPTKATSGKLSGLAELGAGRSKIFDATYEVNLPGDYLHILNCICIYEVNKNYKCYNMGDDISFPAKRLTADSWSVIVNDYYNRPLPERPYFYIHNVNTSDLVPTDPYNAGAGTDMVGAYQVTPEVAPSANGTSFKLTGKYIKDDGSKVDFTNQTPKQILEAMKNVANKYVSYEVTSVTLDVSATVTAAGDSSNFKRKIYTSSLSNNDASNSEKATAYRYGNASKVRMEIRYGHDASVFTLKKVFIDYIKTPQYIRLTQEQVNLTEDTSQVMEFPDYVCQEIINEFVLLIQENTADPRTQSHLAVTQSIPSLAPQTQPQQAARG